MDEMNENYSLLELIESVERRSSMFFRKGSYDEVCGFLTGFSFGQKLMDNVNSLFAYDFQAWLRLKQNKEFDNWHWSYRIFDDLAKADEATAKQILFSYIKEYLNDIGASSLQLTTECNQERMIELKRRIEYFCKKSSMAKDKYHQQVREALEKDGWTITHDPYKIMLGRRKGFIDLGAEILAAEKGMQKIAVEIKSFLGASDLYQFEDALGQFLVYLPALSKKEPERTLYLAVPEEFHDNFFEDAYFLEIAELYRLKMLIFNEKNNSIVKWTN
jgi:XisH protein